jgi:glycosyltransferase involved in cell wall biosynthesis
MTATLHVIHTVPSLGVSAGGPSRTVPALCAAIAAACPDITVEIITSEQPAYGANVVAEGVPTFTAPAGSSFGALKDLLATRLAFAHAQSRTVLLHDHGQWLALNRASAEAARRLRVSRIVSPRGMLTPWALRHHAWKKTLAWHLYAKRHLLSAAALHATSRQEAAELRALGARQPIAVIPNGVHALDDRRTSASKTRTMVFLSRLHPKKGVRELVDAWRAAAPNGWRLVLAGPDEAQMLGSLRLVPSDTIDYIGEVDGERKRDLLESASVVVLPSYSENFGVVVAEALMAGTPVIATHGTPWEGLVRERCGWWIPMTPDSLTQAVRGATSLDNATLAAMGGRGKAWVTENFLWPAIGGKMAAFYRWLAHGGDSPFCVSMP